MNIIITVICILSGVIVFIVNAPNLYLSIRYKCYRNELFMSVLVSFIGVGTALLGFAV